MQNDSLSTVHMVSPLVSIITPTFNHERYVQECIESVLAQGYDNWEQIVVDDGSTDATRQIVERYRDARIRFIQLPHRGLSALEETYNTALERSHGDLVAILEGDDRWPVDKLELQIPTFDDPDVFLSWGAANLINENGHALREFRSVHTSRSSVCFDHKALFARLVRANLLAPTASVMVRRTALERIGGFRQTGTSLYVDLPTWLWVALTERGSACFLNEVLAHYRVHREQTTQTFRREMESSHLDIVLAIEREAAPEALRAAGWGDRMRARSCLAGTIADGVGALATGDFADAHRAFRRALRDADSSGDRARAVLGLLSATLHIDLLTPAYRLKTRPPVLSRRRTRL